MPRSARSGIRYESKWQREERPASYAPVLHASCAAVVVLGLVAGVPFVGALDDPVDDGDGEDADDRAEE